MSLLAGAVLALALVGAACVPEPPPPPPHAVVVYGDSLTGEARESIRARIQALVPDRQVLIHAYGGTAQCDWHQQMQDDAAAFTLDAVVIQFSGNNFTSCITSRTQRVSPPPISIADAYWADAQWAVDFWRGRGVPLAFVAGPGRVNLLPSDDAVGAMYRSVGASRSVLVVDPAPLFVGDDGRYSGHMPCLVGECEGDVIQVRSFDGVHFCVSPPVGPGGCSTYASGSVRFAEAIVHGVASLVGAPQPPYRTMVTPTTSTTTTTTSTTTTSTTTTSTTSTTTSTTTTTTSTIPPLPE